MAPELPWKKKSSSARARASETRGAKHSGGRRVPMSGAGHQKGDIKTDRWLIEDKLTDKGAFSISLKMLGKTICEALESRRLPQWRITIQGQTFRMMTEEDYLAFEAQIDKSLAKCQIRRG